MRTKRARCANAKPGDFHVVKDDGACISCALRDEFKRLNDAADSKAIILKTPDSLTDGHRLIGMRDDFWLITLPPGSQHQRSWCLCNDGFYASILKQAGVERNKLFKE